MRAITLAFAIAAVLPLSSALAQLAELQPGAKVRVNAPSVLGRTLTGPIIARSTDSITIARQGTLPITIALGDVKSIEISEGKSRGAGAKRGAIIGAGIMGVLAVAMAATPESCDPNTDYSCVQFPWALVPVSTLSGAMYGAGIGALIGREKWESLNVPATVTVRRMAGGRTGVGASVRF